MACPFPPWMALPRRPWREARYCKRVTWRRNHRGESKEVIITAKLGSFSLAAHAPRGDTKKTEPRASVRSPGLCQRHFSYKLAAEAFKLDSFAINFGLDNEVEKTKRLENDLQKYHGIYFVKRVKLGSGCLAERNRCADEKRTMGSWK